ncbi:hypothetical protein N9018_00675 [Rhodopirellula sp.]|nr:hypothetical protein [Rhodopirellula sp.]
MPHLELGNAIHERKLQRDRKPTNERADVLPMAGSDNQTSSAT